MLATWSTLAGAQAAWPNALQTDETQWAAGGPHGGARGVAVAVFAVLSLGHMLRTSSEAQAAHGRNAARHAQLARQAEAPLC